MSVAWVAVGASVLGTAASVSASKSASKTQAQSADNATALQKEMFDKQVELQAPFRDAGLAAQNRLMYLMGLPSGSAGASGGSGSSYTGGTSGGTAAPLDANALRAQLIGQFTTAGTPGGYVGGSGGSGAEGDGQMYSYQAGTPGTVDEAGLQAEINRRLAEQSAQSAQTPSGQPGGTPGTDPATDPAYGSLMRDFSMADYQADPGYAFRLQQGQQALERSAAARGGLFSGRAAKDLTDYAQGQASQEYANAFNRFQVNRTNKLNPLQSLMGAGQTSANTIGAAAQNYATQAGANITGAGNARASGYLTTGNAVQNGINGAVSGFNRYYSGGPVNFAGSSGGNALYPDYGSASGGTGGWV